MTTKTDPAEELAAVRGDLLIYLAGSLSTLYPEPIDEALAAWVDPLPLRTLLACWRPSPAATADALATALEDELRARSRDCEVSAAIAVEFPQITGEPRRRLVAYVAAVRLLMSEHGEATANALFALGFTSRENHNLKRYCDRLLAVLSGEARPRQHTEALSPAMHLRGVGEWAASLRSLAA
jgi:hypothetical protein